jgi:hypothetical protein
MVVCTSVFTEEITMWARRLRRISASSGDTVVVRKDLFSAQDPAPENAAAGTPASYHLKRKIATIRCRKKQPAGKRQKELPQKRGSSQKGGV